MFENAEKADEIIRDIADSGLAAAEQGSVQGRLGFNGWSKLGEKLCELAQASPTACEQLAQAWERSVQNVADRRRIEPAQEAAGQAYLAADYVRYREGCLKNIKSHGSYVRPNANGVWMADCKAVCEVTQEFDDEGELRDCTSINFVDNFGGIREGRDELVVDALNQLAQDGLSPRHGCGWSAEEIYDQAHESWGLGAWGDTTELSRAAEVAKVVFEERTLSRQIPQVAKAKAARI